MKKLITLLAACFVLAGYSQTNQPPTGSFYQSALSYFTAFNTNLDSTFGESKGQVWAGVDSLQNSETPVANSIGLSYRLYRGVSGEAIIRDAGVSGALVNAQAGLGLNVVVHDAQLTIYGHGGNDLQVKKGQDRWYGEVGLRAAKALTDHTYAGTGFGVKVPNNDRVFTLFAGFTF